MRRYFLVIEYQRLENQGTSNPVITSVSIEAIAVNRSIGGYSTQPQCLGTGGTWVVLKLSRAYVGP